MSWMAGPKLFQKFWIHLSGAQKNNWETAVNGLSKTVVGFDAMLVTWKNATLTGCAHCDQMEHV